MIGPLGAAAGILALSLAAATPSPAPEAIALSWDATGTYSSSLTRPAFDNLRVVPGDSGAREFTVRNDGPGPAVLTAELVNIAVTGNAADAYYSDFVINDVPIRERLDRSARLLSVELPRGAHTTIPLSYAFPVSATSGNYGADTPEAVSVSFDVRLLLRGDTETEPATPTAGPGDSSSPAAQGTSAPLAATGAGAWIPLALGGAALACTGLVLRRRRSSVEGHTPDPS